MALYVPPSAFFKPVNLPLAELTRLTQNRDGEKVGHKAQHRANAGWAERNGLVIGQTFREENINTSDKDVVREVLEQILAGIQAGRFGGILVWRADRLTRQRRQYERIIDLIKPHRAIVCVSYENLTSVDPDGEDRIATQVAQAQREVQNLKIRIKANSDERKQSGHYHGGGFRPWCFEGPKRDKKTGKVLNRGRIGVKHVKCEVELAKEAANRIAWENWTYRDVIEDWHARTPPVMASTGAPWSITTLQRALTSPRMVGKQLVRVVDPDTGVVLKAKMKKAQWKPVLSKETWDKLRTMVKTAEHKPGKIKYLLTPILECGRCQQHLTGCNRIYLKMGERIATTTYRCRSGTNDKARGACGALQVLADPVEKLVIARVFQRLIRTREVGSGLRQTDDIQEKIGKQHKVVERLRSELKVLDVAQQDRDHRLETTTYLANRRALRGELDEESAKLGALQQQLDVPYPVGNEWEDLPKWFNEGLNFGQRQKLIRAHIAKVIVLAPGRSGRYFKPERVVVIPADSKKTDGKSD